MKKDLLSKARKALAELTEEDEDAWDLPEGVDEIEPALPELNATKDLRPPSKVPQFWYQHQSQFNSIVSDGDIHYPLQDPYLEAAKIAFVRDVKPDIHVNVGDAYDLYYLSSFPKQATKALDYGSVLQSELDAARPYWKAMAENVKSSHLILGNHEERLSRLLNLNVGLFGLRSLGWKRMAELPDNVTVHDYGTVCKFGNITYEHGDRIGSKWGVMHPDRWVLDRKPGRTTIFGHTHRCLCEYRTVWEWTDAGLAPVTYAAFNQGHNCDELRQQDWAPQRDWTKSFTYVEYFTVAGKRQFMVHPIVVINGCFSWGGKVYDGRKWQ